jgi:phosphoglycolate phosphatase-like HAD superfamily hydrolase
MNRLAIFDCDGTLVDSAATGIGAGWGYHDAHELLAAGAAAVADQPLDVLPLIGQAREELYG